MIFSFERIPKIVWGCDSNLLLPLRGTKTIHRLTVSAMAITAFIVESNIINHCLIRAIKSIAITTNVGMFQLDWTRPPSVGPKPHF